MFLIFYLTGVECLPCEMPFSISLGLHAPCSMRHAPCAMLPIPLGFTPWNSCSACLLAKSDRIGGDRLNLVHRGGVITLGGTIFHWGIMKEML